MSKLAILSLVLIAIPVRPDRFPPPPAPPATPSIYGSWQLTEYHLNGTTIPQSTADNLSVAIAGDEFTMINKSGKSTTVYRLTFEPNRNPAIFDFTPKNGSKIAYIGIVKVEGDTMTIAFTREGQERPLGFELPQAPMPSQRYVWKLRRIGS